VWGVVVAVTLVAGCTVGPTYHAPTAPKNNAYQINKTTSGSTSSNHNAIRQQVFKRAGRVRADWYKIFGSDKLNALIGQALAHNPSLAAGRARLKAAHEAVKASKGALLPQISANAGVSHNKANGTRLGIAQKRFVNVFNLYQGQLTARYNLDLFGKTRRRIERSAAQLHERRYRVLNTYVTLINNIVASAIAEAGVNAALQTTHQIIHAQKQSLKIIRKQIQYGAALQNKASQLQTQLAATQASLAPLRKQRMLAVNRLAVLTGSTPGTFSDPKFQLDQLKLPQKLPVSVPAQLVKHRPDILAAASALHAASAEVGVATANRLPNITLSASYGRNGLNPGDLANPVLAVYSIGAQLTAPIFEGGRLSARQRQAKHNYDAARADYRAKILSAFGNVSDSLRSLTSDSSALKARKRALHAARNNLDTVKAQLRHGAADYESLYQAQAQYRRIDLHYTKARVTRYRDTAALFRALGGGWWNAKGAPLAKPHSKDASTGVSNGKSQATNSAKTSN